MVVYLFLVEPTDRQEAHKKKPSKHKKNNFVLARVVKTQSRLPREVVERIRTRLDTVVDSMAWMTLG